MGENDVGRRIREVRAWRGLSLRATAELTGITHGYLAQLERGEKPVKNRQLLEALARTLRVSPVEFLADAYGPPVEPATEAFTAMAELADLLGGWWVGEVPDAPTRPLAGVLADLRRFHEARNSPGPKVAGDYPTQIGTLSRLIRDLLAAAAEPAHEHRVLAPLLTAYHVAGSIAMRLRIPGLPSLAADRMQQVADRLDDPVWQAVAAWGRAQFLSGANRARQYELAVAAADMAPADRPETRGMANLTAAMAAATQGDADLAETHLAEAAAIAERVEPDVSPWPAGVMQFGRTNVGIFRVTVGVELGHGARVAEVAEGVRLETISRGRQASFWLDYGRGLLTDRGRRDEGLSALLRAEQLAPQQVHTNVFAREAVAELQRSSRRDASGREVRGLAWRMGLAPTG